MHTSNRHGAAGTIKSKISPLDFYLRELPEMPYPRREHGWVRGGLCPFHPDRRPNSVNVHLDTGCYHCFSCGNSASDIIDFVMRRDGLSFHEAKCQLSHEWGGRL